MWADLSCRVDRWWCAIVRQESVAATPPSGITLWHHRYKRWVAVLVPVFWAERMAAVALNKPVIPRPHPRQRLSFAYKDAGAAVVSCHRCYRLPPTHTLPCPVGSWWFRRQVAVWCDWYITFLFVLRPYWPSFIEKIGTMNFTRRPLLSSFTWLWIVLRFNALAETRHFTSNLAVS